MASPVPTTYVSFAPRPRRYSHAVSKASSIAASRSASMIRPTFSRTPSRHRLNWELGPGKTRVPTPRWVMTRYVSFPSIDEPSWTYCSATASRI